MRKPYLVAVREYLEAVRTKGFWIGILMLPILLVVGTFLPGLLEDVATPTRHFVLVDPSGKWADPIEERLEERYQARVQEARSKRVAEAMAGAADPSEPFVAPRRRFERVALPDWFDYEDLEASKDRLASCINGEEAVSPDRPEIQLFAFVSLHERLDKTHAGVEYWSANLADRDLLEIVQNTLNGIVREMAYAKTGIDQGEIERIQSIRIGVSEKNAKREGEAVSTADTVRAWVPVAFVYLLWIAVLMIGQMLLTNTIEEKSNRLVEVLLSSVTPSELMAGKLFGIASIGLTMVLAWALAFFLQMKFLGPLADIPFDLMEIVSANYLGYFLLYFLLGFLLFGSIFLAVGSMCSTLKDAQNFMAPVTLLMVVPLLTMIPVAKEPNGSLAVILSFIPPFTPFVMMNRIAGPPPMWHMVSTTAILLVSVLFSIWLAGKVFRVGILMTGKPPKIREIVRWMRS